MLRKILFGFLLAPIFFSACKKSDNTPANVFKIDGIHDINFSTGSPYLGLSIVQTTGTQQPVTITVSGLPAGVTADISPSGGTPDFSCSIGFGLAGNTVGGTYPIKIIGTSTSYSRSYDLNLIVPAFNGFIMDGQYFRTGYMSHNSSSGYNPSTLYVNSSDNGGGYLVCTIYDVLPTADGTYTYQLDGSTSGSNTMQVACTLSSGYNSYSLAVATGKTATVKITGGKMSLSFPAITLDDYNGGHKDLSVSASE